MTTKLLEQVKNKRWYDLECEKDEILAVADERNVVNLKKKLQARKL